MRLLGSNSGKIKHLSLWITIIVIVVVGIGLYIWYRSSTGAVSISAQIDQPAATVGLPLTIKVDLSNNSDSDLSDVQLSVTLPSNLPPADGSGALVISRDMGNVSKGSISEQTFQVIPLPDINSNRTVTIVAYYNIGSLRARFQAESTLNVDVQSLPLALQLTSPTTTFSGEQMAITAMYGWGANVPTNISSSTNLPPLSVQLIYPDTFSLSSSAPSVTTASNNTWPIDTLTDSSTDKVVVNGSVSLPDQTQFTTTANIVASILGKNYVVASTSTQTMVATSPLSLNIWVNGATSTIAQPGNVLNYTLSYKNNTQVTFQDIVIKANIAGSMLVWNTLRSSSSPTFDSNTDTLTWDSSSVPGLMALAPGASGNVTFSVALAKTYPIAQLNDKDFSVRVNATASSPTVPYLINANQTVSTASSLTKIAGKLTLETDGYFRDASSGLINSGPWPPKVGVPTEYTIHWTLTNYSTDLTNVQVEAQLPPGVTFTGQSSANISAVPQYASSTNQMIWDVGSLPATSGILTPAPEAIFQVSATPQPSDVGNYMGLLEPTVVSAQDSFTNLPVTAGSDAISTLLPSDPTVSSSQGLVTN